MEVVAAANIIKDDEISIAKRMRALFYLRNEMTPESVNAIAGGFKCKSVLLKHEVAYVLGQMCLDESKDILMRVLSDETEDEIVRHEAGEALGNYELSEDILQILEKYSEHPKKPISETCYIAKMNIRERGYLKGNMSKHDSRDPAPPLNSNFEDAKRILLDSSECMYKRYQAMFFLRDLGSSDAVHALGEAMSDCSSLFKHEISFVFGQMRNIESIPYLIRKMNDANEHGMVRHECAEALGAIGNEVALEELVKHIEDPCDILRESVEVAVDIHNYITSEELEYCKC
ncbi:hypothetical protein CWI42_070550 [Ordospora colligata]|uniref:Deoxyhypusine hydroxylase n=1 Tax=Ordospora colligata OC4 TaxID=1354746 RepID=A0A0B2UKB0_9MICR|nr:uncharacterized protein M896_070550 [Ordospora colligata OC4]KHN69487.1 hypothetical protein M896_070550 [Ordospora colligata OC4]TBU15231.1 hypothetical protein CWI41_070550 [Ordospora colligata]TBU15302.1 hypothetical protein CWI40_070550 [Ordospora colligata]TBU18484.1 hypothetical protein CWI42_070550 [Ordospora colligata]